MHVTKIQYYALNKTTCEKSLWFHVNTIGKHQNHRGISKKQNVKGYIWDSSMASGKGGMLLFLKNYINHW